MSELKKFGADTINFNIGLKFEAGPVSILGPGYTLSLGQLDVYKKVLLNFRCNMINHKLNRVQRSICYSFDRAVEPPVDGFWAEAYLAVGIKGKYWVGKYLLKEESCDLDGDMHREHSRQGLRNVLHAGAGQLRQIRALHRG